MTNTNPKTWEKAWRDALASGRQEWVDSLLLRGRPPEVLHDGTPLLHAVDSVWAVSVLLSAGADPMAVDGAGRTALHAAAARLNLPLVDRFLAEGFYAGARTHKKRTPLHEACKTARGRGRALAVVERLLQAGAPVDAVDHKGRSAAHYAARTGRRGVLMALRRAGAAFDRPDATGRTAEQWLTRRARFIGWLVAHERVVRQRAAAPSGPGPDRIPSPRPRR